MADEQKTDGEVFAEYQKNLDELEAKKAAAYEEAGTAPPGVLNRNPDTTTPERNYASRDNIVVSGASPAHIQAAVEALGDDELRARALDAADVAQAATREDYEKAVLAVEPGATKEEVEDAPQDVAQADEEPDGPKASGSEPEGTELEHEGTPVTAPDEDALPPHAEADSGPEPEHQQESGPDAVQSDGASLGRGEPEQPVAEQPKPQE